METVIAEKPLNIVTFKQTIWFSLLGGYLGGFYLISLNYKAMGYPQLAKKALRTGLISTILLFIFMAFLSVFADQWTKPFLTIGALAQGLVGMVYLMHEHYKTVDNHNRWKECLVALCLVVPVMLAPFYLPTKLIDYIPAYMSILLPALVVSQFVKSQQEIHLKESGLQKIPKRKLLGSMLIALVLTIAIAFAIGFTIALIAYLINPELLV